MSTTTSTPVPDAVLKLEGTSVTAFLASLILSSVLFAISMLIFILARTAFHTVYEPRAYDDTLPQEKRVRKLPRTPWGWLRPLWRMYRDSDDIIQKSGIDAYFFMRFLRMVIIIFAPAMLIIWPILLPLNIIGGVNYSPGTGQSNVNGLDRLAFGNVNRSHTSRYWAHLILAYLFVIWICCVTTYEMIHYVKARQAWLMSQDHRKKAAATTILVTSIPKAYLSEQKIRRLFSTLPGGVKHVWLNRDCSNLLVAIEARDAICRTLELAEVQLLQRAAKNMRTNRLPKVDEDLIVRLADRYVHVLERPQHRLAIATWFFSLPNWSFIGKKVDTIDWCKSELRRMNNAIEMQQSRPEEFRAVNSAFVQFHEQIAAHMAVQSVTHHALNVMSPKYLETSPNDVVWPNMHLHWWERYIWITFVWVLVITFTIFYAIPVVFIGSLSHITELVKILPWLAFLNTDRPAARVWSGIVTGILPTVLLVIIVAVVPFLFKFAARLQGFPSRPTISLATQDMYFFFLFIQLFLVVTIASGVTAFISSAVNNPSNVPQILATDLPKAANFFFSYMILQGLSVSSVGLAQTWFLFLFWARGLFSTTPRAKWKRMHNIRTLTWGTMYPTFSVLASIGIIYSIIAPLIMIFVIIAFGLFMVAHLYSFMFVFDFVTDTGGRAFPKAVQQMYVGVYFLELCLTGLFFLVRNSNNEGVPCKVQGIMMVVLILLTACFQTLAHRNIKPLLDFLPLTSSEQDMMTPESENGSQHATIGAQNVPSVSTTKDPDEVNSCNLDVTEHEALLINAYRHEALRRRRPVVWLPSDEIGLAADELAKMPAEIPASCSGAILTSNGSVVMERDARPPDYVPSDNILL